MYSAEPSRGADLEGQLWSKKCPPGADLEGQLWSKKCPRGADLEGQLWSKKCPRGADLEGQLRSKKCLSATLGTLRGTSLEKQIRTRIGFTTNRTGPTDKNTSAV